MYQLNWCFDKSEFVLSPPPETGQRWYNTGRIWGKETVAILSRQEDQKLKRERSNRKRNRGLTIAGSLAVLVLAGTLIVRFGFHSTKPAPSVTPSASAAKKTDEPKASSSPVSSPSSPSPSSAPAAILPPSTADPGLVKLSFVGDVLLGSTVENVMKQNGFDHPYKDVKSFLQRADITVANLETPITERGVEQKKEYVYRSSPNTLPAFKEAGFDIVNLANNHVMDYGKEGLLDTFQHLDQAGIKRIGAGKDAEEAYKPVIMESKGMKIAFLGFSRVVPDNSWKAGKNHPGVAETYDYRLPVDAITQARTQADLVVVIAHWGDERTDKPNNTQTELAKRYIDAGADLVVASHPHVLQGFESYKGKWIAYSLGNFIFTTNNVKDTEDTVILEAACSKDRKCDLSLIPIYTIWAKPEPMSEEAGSKLIDRLNKISFRTKINPNGKLLPLP